MRLVVGTDRGVRIVERAARGWRARGPALAREDVHDVARFRGALYAATYGHGVLRSADGGATWTPANRGLVHPVVRSLLALDDALLAGTEPARAFRSTGGLAWTELSLGALPEAAEWYLPYSPRAGALRHLLADRVDRRRIYGAIEVGGVAVSHDAGRTWTMWDDGLHPDVHALAQSPYGDLYAATGGGFFGAWKQRPGGAPRGAPRRSGSRGAPSTRLRWRGAHRGIHREYISAAAALPGGVVVIAGSWGPGEACQIYRSEDRGRSFHTVTRGLPREFPSNVWALAAAPDALYLGSAEGTLFLSRDTGLSWTTLVEGLGSVQALMIEG